MKNAKLAYVLFLSKTGITFVSRIWRHVDLSLEKNFYYCGILEKSPKTEFTLGTR